MSVRKQYVLLASMAVNASRVLAFSIAFTTRNQPVNRHEGLSRWRFSPFEARRIASPCKDFNDIRNDCIPSTHLFSSSKWDNLVDEDDEEEGMPKPPADVDFVPNNILKLVENYRAISSVGGSDTVVDMYVRNSRTSTFWFAGKVARCTGTVGTEEAIRRLWHMIEQHAARLRNNELGPHYGKLEIWYAPGNSEMEVAYNRPSLQFTKVERPKTQAEVNELARKVKVMEVGFQGEFYENNEEGFRTQRTDEGLPVGKEIQAEVLDELPEDAKSVWKKDS